MNTSKLSLLIATAAAMGAFALTGIATAYAISGPVATAEKPVDPTVSVQPVAAPPAKKTTIDKKDVERRIAVRFEKAPWQEVLDWYSKESGLILNTTLRPTGTVTIKPPDIDRKFTLAEVTDLINECLAPQKLLLMRYNTTFTIWPTDEGFLHLPTISPKELKLRGKTELVRCVIGPFKNISVAEIRLELEALLTPFGKLQILERSNSVQISDKAGNILRIMGVLEEIENAPPKFEPPADFPNVKPMIRSRACFPLLNRWRR